MYAKDVKGDESITMKKVWALYRVSTKNQVTVDDIPMQKNACHDFIQAKSDWILDKELYEKGVSGWSNYSEDRDVLVEIKKAAEQNLFDVLLVFMFDRLGRKDDETPFIVEFFIKQGIEVWSVKEGQRTLESHIDKLMNYITFWQSSGESLKTSIRVKEEMKQMNERGQYTGGIVAFGYEVYDTEIPHLKKDKTIKDIRVNPIEAEQIKIMRDLILLKGFGGRRIAKWLKENNYKTRSGSNWQPAEITRTLKNPIYKGYQRYATSSNRNNYMLQPKREELAIITEEDWHKIQQLINIRDTKTKSITSENNLPTHSKYLLLSGLAYCGYCDSKLGIQRTKNKNNGNYYIKYQCSKWIRNIDVPNHEQKIFGSKKYETLFENMLFLIIRRINTDNLNSNKLNYKSKLIEDKIKLKERIIKEKEEKVKELKLLEKEITKVLLGKSKFNEETLANLIDELKNEINEFDIKISSINKELDNDKITSNEINSLVEELTNWEEKYKNADFDTKKIMLSKLINKVIIKKKSIEIDFKVTFKNIIENLDV